MTPVCCNYCKRQTKSWKQFKK